MGYQSDPEGMALVRQLRTRLLQEPDPDEGQPLIRFRPPNSSALPLAVRRAEQGQRRARPADSLSREQRQAADAEEWLRRRKAKEERRRLEKLAASATTGCCPTRSR